MHLLACEDRTSAAFARGCSATPPSARGIASSISSCLCNFSCSGRLAWLVGSLWLSARRYRERFFSLSCGLVPEEVFRGTRPCLQRTVALLSQRVQSEVFSLVRVPTATNAGKRSHWWVARMGEMPAISARKVGGTNPEIMLAKSSF